MRGGVIKTKRFAQYSLDNSPISYDIKGMDIQSLSVELSQQRVQEEAAIQIQSMAQNAVEVQSAELQKLMETAEAVTAAVTDPQLGNTVNLIA
jgi:hypothetical protein